jgi:Spy/CpxP family protein refolding chaperone
MDRNPQSRQRLIGSQAAGKEMGMHGGLQAAVESLNLTNDQKAKVKDIFADAKTKRQAVSSDASLSDEQKKAKMKELHSATMAKLNEVLTPEQQAELKSKMETAKAKPPSQPRSEKPPSQLAKDMREEAPGSEEPGTFWLGGETFEHREWRDLPCMWSYFRVAR